MNARLPDLTPARGGYADEVLKEYAASDFDHIEVQGVRLVPGTNTVAEFDNENPDRAYVYLHLKEGGTECCGEFAEHWAASEYAAELEHTHGWQVTDYVALAAGEQSEPSGPAMA